jgi:hypothetical protein
VILHNPNNHWADVDLDDGALPAQNVNIALDGTG